LYQANHLADGTLVGFSFLFLSSFVTCVFFLSFHLRLVILRVHSHGLVTIDLQCYEEDNIVQLDNVSDLKTQKILLFSPLMPKPEFTAVHKYVLSPQLLNALEKKLKVLLNGNIARIKK